MNNQKFWSQTSDRGVDGKLVWPGAHGLPALIPNGQSPPLLEKGKIDEADIDARPFARCFDLSNESERREYLEIIEKVVHGLYHIYKEDRWRSDDSDYPKVYLEWVQLYAIPPRGSN